jgi:hypothetical protein
MSDDKALTFAAQINELHQEIIKGFHKGTLEYAIKAGDLLILAKENVKAKKEKWTEWREQNCPDIPQTTASMYMRLAENKAIYKNQQRVATNLAAGGDLSLRAALKLIPRTPDQVASAEKAKAAREANKVAAAEQAKAEAAKYFKSRTC